MGGVVRFDFLIDSSGLAGDGFEHGIGAEGVQVCTSIGKG